MLTLNVQLEHRLQQVAHHKGITVPQLIEDFLADYDAEQAALDRAEESLIDYRMTGQTVSLQQLIEQNDLEH